MSDAAKIKRTRRNTINIQMSFLSWSLEFIAGIIFLVSDLVYKDITELYLYLLFIDNTLTFVIIPSSYILNTEVIKDFIIANGWSKPIRTLFPSRKIGQAPNNNNELQANPNAAISHRVATKPIPTISGNYIVTAECGSPVDDDDFRMTWPSEEHCPATTNGQNMEKFKKNEYINLDVNKLSA